jgi:putative Mn2+ efflux pump MntP
MIEVIILALALSMDAFAVSIGLGAKHSRNKLLSLSLMSAVYFGLFQGIMPLIGYAGGKGVLFWVEAYAPWIAFALLVIIGGKMIYESFSDGVEDDIARVSHRIMLMLAIATSIDAMAAGFTLTLLTVNPWIACFVIALTTAILSAIGVVVGARTGTWLENKAEFIGGATLILIAIKVIS